MIKTTTSATTMAITVGISGAAACLGSVIVMVTAEALPEGHAGDVLAMNVYTPRSSSPDCMVSSTSVNIAVSQTTIPVEGTQSSVVAPPTLVYPMVYCGFTPVFPRAMFSVNSIGSDGALTYSCFWVEILTVAQLPEGPPCWSAQHTSPRPHVPGAPNPLEQENPISHVPAHEPSGGVPVQHTSPGSLQVPGAGLTWHTEPTSQVPVHSCGGASETVTCGPVHEVDSDAELIEAFEVNEPSAP